MTNDVRCTLHEAASDNAAKTTPHYCNPKSPYNQHDTRRRAQCGVVVYLRDLSKFKISGGEFCRIFEECTTLQNKVLVHLGRTGKRTAPFGVPR